MPNPNPTIILLAVLPMGGQDHRRHPQGPVPRSPPTTTHRAPRPSRTTSPQPPPSSPPPRRPSNLSRMRPPAPGPACPPPRPGERRIPCQTTRSPRAETATNPCVLCGHELSPEEAAHGEVHDSCHRAFMEGEARQHLEIWPESGLSRRAFIIGVNKRSEG